LGNQENKSRRILIYDTDGTNPYGRELAALLGTTFVVRAFLSAHTEWMPPAISARCILPSSAPSWFVVQIGRQIRALATVAWTMLLERATVVVVMTRSWYDQCFLAGLAMTGGRIVVIVHDPVPKKPLSWIATISRRMLLKYSTVVVAHSENLAAQTAAISGREARVVPHLPFVEYAAWARSIAPDVASPKECRLLILGQMRDDKGLDRLPTIFEFVPKGVRKQISISFAGRGDCGALISKLRPLVSVTNTPSDRIISDIELAQELAKSDVLLAAYPIVSTSGTVVLALSRGLRVIAYDTGALAEVVAPDGLVALGDERSLAKCIVGATKTRHGNPLYPIRDWRQASLRAWLEAIT
jgi:glycosyltransferase involved in cell wall biosynthesis